ncbi:MAG TPA: FtsX-like permease family protein [Coriobacteriia bacterium]|nr:FtsX-like permease family protein [Coriobacteriia bacterium]
MLSFKIAWRFLRSSPVQSILIAGGIAVGIATQVFVGSLIQSLQANLLDSAIGSQPHITIQAQTEGDPVAYTDRMQKTVEEDPHVKQGTVAKLRTVSSLYTDGTDSAPLVLLGGDLRELEGLFKLNKKMVEGTPSLRSDEIMLGKEFAKKYDLNEGDSVKLSFQTGGSTTFTVAGVFDLGAAAFNERNAFVAGEVPRSLLGWSAKEYSAIEAQLVEPFQSAEVAAAWRRKLPGIEVVEWQAQNASLLVGIQSQSSSSYMIQGFVLVAVALGIASTLAIAAVQKTRQIGILKAMGLSDSRAGRIFLWQAALLGVGGSALGVGLAYLFLWLFALAPLLFTVTTDPVFVAGSFLVGVGVALASAIVPIRRTSKLDPIEVIQGG